MVLEHCINGRVCVQVTERFRLACGLGRDRNGWRLVFFHMSAGLAYVYDQDPAAATQDTMVTFVEHARRGLVPPTRLRAV